MQQVQSYHAGTEQADRAARVRCIGIPVSGRQIAQRVHGGGQRDHGCSGIGIAVDRRDRHLRQAVGVGGEQQPGIAVRGRQRCRGIAQPKVVAELQDVQHSNAYRILWRGAVQAPPVVNLKAFLEGPANPAATAMNTYLGDNSLLPQQQPYSAAPWSYSGSESVTSMPSGVVDWVLLTLRTASGAETEVAARAALLKGDGSITDTDGSSPVRFPEILAGDYYICLYQRNHLGIMSKLPVSLSSSSALYDFSLGQDQAYGINPLKELSATVFALRSGDGNADGGVDVLDKNLIWRPQNGNPWAYGNYGDFNLDGGIDVLDLNLKWRPDNGTGSQIPN